MIIRRTSRFDTGFVPQIEKNFKDYLTAVRNKTANALQRKALVDHIAAILIDDKARQQIELQYNYLILEVAHNEEELVQGIFKDAIQGLKCELKNDPYSLSEEIKGLLEYHVKKCSDTYDDNDQPIPATEAEKLNSLKWTIEKIRERIKNREGEVIDAKMIAKPYQGFTNHLDLEDVFNILRPALTGTGVKIQLKFELMNFKDVNRAVHILKSLQGTDISRLTIYGKFANVEAQQKCKAAIPDVKIDEAYWAEQLEHRRAKQLQKIRKREDTQRVYAPSFSGSSGDQSSASASSSSSSISSTPKYQSL